MLLIVLGITDLNAQDDRWRKFEHRLFQFSLTPGLSTNGLQQGSYINHFSLNTTSGYSGGNKGIEIGIISNLNVEITRGFQFAGFANITGANAFAGMNRKEVKEKIATGFEANLHGGQFAGFLNLVTNNVFGAQFSGGFNGSKALFGLQIAGISNAVQNYAFAVQLAGISNTVGHSIDGVQIASLLNLSTGQLQGVQLGAFNYAGIIEGKNSTRNNSLTGLQLGIVNKAKRMNGFQIGLINFGGKMQGTQLGLINFYQSGGEVDTRDGTSIGLLNIGQTVNLKVYANEHFVTNYSLITGTGKNFRLRQKNYNVYILNELIFGYNPKVIKDDATNWSLGYGVTYAIYNRSSLPGQSEKRFGEIGLQLHHYQIDESIDHFNLFSKIFGNVGHEIFPKLSGIYFFGGLSYNIFHGADQVQGITKDEPYENKNSWLGYQAGIMIH